MKTNLRSNIILLIIIIVALILSLANHLIENDIKDEKETNTEQIPTLKIDPNIFSGGEISSGSWSDNKWSSATIVEGYRSQPTTTITLKPDYYDQDVKDLSPVLPDKDIYIMEDNMGAETFTEQIKKYGDLARRFLPNDLINYVEYFDVDKDGKDEQIIASCGLWGNGCPHGIFIVKNGKIIFTTVGNEIIKTENGNGFAIVWQKEYKDPYGEMRTRFVFEDGKFKPIYEQEVKYFIAEQ